MVLSYSSKNYFKYTVQVGEAKTPGHYYVDLLGATFSIILM